MTSLVPVSTCSRFSILMVGVVSGIIFLQFYLHEEIEIDMNSKISKITYMCRKIIAGVQLYIQYVTVNEKRDHSAQKSLACLSYGRRRADQ